jgi:hypothetical protein
MNHKIQVSYNGDNYTVDVLTNDECAADSHFEGYGAREKAEQRAAALAKMLGCDWESNYY